jgi:hypothetical protein
VPPVGNVNAAGPVPSAVRAKCVRTIRVTY